MLKEICRKISIKEQEIKESYPKNDIK